MCPGETGYPSETATANAVLAIGQGARRGGFAQNTGEGGYSRYHREAGADIIWQSGTGYFGCRGGDGHFDAARFEETSAPSGWNGKMKP